MITLFFDGWPKMIITVQNIGKQTTQIIILKFTGCKTEAIKYKMTFRS